MYKLAILINTVRYIMNCGLTVIKQTKGFTMAEVLITIGIIGVVAAMTLPGLIADKRRTELYNQLQVAYSLISQALSRMNADNEYPVLPSDFNYKGRTFKKSFIKYFDSPIDCGSGGVWTTTNSDLCMTGEQAEDGSWGSEGELSDAYSTFNKASKKIGSNLLDDGQFALKNGMLILIENPEISPADLLISVDVNGKNKNKNPNAWGHDLFTFQIVSDGRLLPMGADGTAYDYDNYCSKTSTNTLNGIGCTQRALTDKTYWSKL